MSVKKVTIIQKVIVSATPHELYDAFVNPEKHSKFTGSKATGKASVGSSFTAWDGYIEGKNLELEKDKKIVQEWTTSEWPQDFPPSRLELRFEGKGDKTEITMVHSRIPANLEADLKQGWIDFYWEPLKDYFEKAKK